jgi:hypothetical protein
MKESRLFLSLHLCAFALVSIPPTLSATAYAEEPRGTLVAPGATIDLFEVWPKIAEAPKSDLATIEFLIRPDSAAINRARSFVWILSNSGGRDTAGLSLILNQGAPHANVFGTSLKSSRSLTADKWSHLALTVNTNTINKQARLWVNGKMVADELIFESWPKSFEVAEMLSDKWNQGRQFSGQLGDVRISKVVRYNARFEPATRLTNDDSTVLFLEGSRIPLGG